MLNLYSITQNSILSRHKETRWTEGQQVTAVWQNSRFSAPQTHLWLIKHWFSASTFTHNLFIFKGIREPYGVVVKIANFAKRQTVRM